MNNLSRVALLHPSRVGSISRWLARMRTTGTLDELKHRSRKGHTNTTHTLGISTPTGNAMDTVRERERDRAGVR